MKHSGEKTKLKGVLGICGKYHQCEYIINVNLYSILFYFQGQRRLYLLPFEVRNIDLYFLVMSSWLCSVGNSATLNYLESVPCSPYRKRSIWFILFSLYVFVRIHLCSPLFFFMGDFSIQILYMLFLYLYL